MEFLFVGLGGFLGANIRYVMSSWIAGWVARTLRISLPVGTMFVNITGSFLLALFVVWTTERVQIPDHMRLLIITGFFGAYTTFSTYANESIALIRAGDWFGGIAVIVGTNLFCLIGVLLGIALGSWLWPTT